MKKFIKNLERIQEVLLVSLLIIMCMVIFLATVGRFTKLFTIVWAEELARYFMIWIIFLGIGVAGKKGEHFSVEVLDMLLPKKSLKVVNIIKVVLVVVFNLVASVWAIKIIRYQVLTKQITPTLHWPMWVMYLAIPVGLLLMAIQYGYYEYSKLKDQRESEG